MPTNITNPNQRAIRSKTWPVVAGVALVIVMLVGGYYYGMLSHVVQELVMTPRTGHSSQENLTDYKDVAEEKKTAPPPQTTEAPVDPWAAIQFEQQKRYVIGQWEKYFAEDKARFDMKMTRQTTAFTNKMKLAETRRTEWMAALRAPGVVDIESAGKATVGGSSPQSEALAAILGARAMQRSGGQGGESAGLEAQAPPQSQGVANTLQSSAISPSYLVEPTSPYYLSAGTHLPITIDQWLSSDAAGGSWVGHVNVDVLDSLSSRHVLIPAWTKVTGISVPDMANNEQPVLNLVATLLQIPADRTRPYGAFLQTPTMAGQNNLGIQGLNGDVNYHRMQRYGSAIILSLISAGVRMAAYSGGGYGDGYYLSPADAAAQGFSQVLGQAVGDELRRKMAIRPTVTVPLGYNFVLTLQQIQMFDRPFERVK